jgi:hypothetical protein
MKKLILALAAVAGLSAGTAFAQANSPQFTGVQPGTTHPQYPNPWGNSGWTPDMAYGSDHNVYPRSYPYHLSQAPWLLSDGRWINRQYVTPYARTTRDRDGDGVRNSRDRYPDDPRYR